MAEDLRVIHVVPGLADASSGIAAAARIIASRQNAQLVEAKGVDERSLGMADEVWVHSTWTPAVWRACFIARGLGKRLVRMPHGNLDPVRRRFGAWKKALAGPFERRSLRMAGRIVVTCEAERSWVEDYLCGRCPPIDVVDMGSLFPAADMDGARREKRGNASDVRVLYMGRRHPLKGVDCLEEAVESLRREGRRITLRVESSVYGADKEAAFGWCHVFCLPTLSDNFGIVVAEALARGKPVITTDGAPAWAGDPRVVYIEGYRGASHSERVRLLRSALVTFFPKTGTAADVTSQNRGTC